MTGNVYADWNGNGALDAGEEPLEGIPVRVGETAAVTTTREGEFAFLNVSAGFQRVGLDTGALPLETAARLEKRRAITSHGSSATRTGERIVW